MKPWHDRAVAEAAGTTARGLSPGSPGLLTRDEFERQVFLRSAGRCVFCTQPAVDAHHIVERKLFADGGYYLDNGAAVCAAHHWDCETTVMSVEEVLAACGLLAPRLPAGFPRGVRIDKWGNRLRADGLREPGPLYGDAGCRRALRVGGFLGLFVPHGTPIETVAERAATPQPRDRTARAGATAPRRLITERRS